MLLLTCVAILFAINSFWLGIKLHSYIIFRGSLIVQIAKSMAHSMWLI